MSVEYFAIVKEVVVNVCQFQLGSLSMKPVIQFNAALSTMFDHVIDANSELCQQLVELKADCDRLAADRADALKVLLSVCLLPYCQLFYVTVCHGITD